LGKKLRGGGIVSHRKRPFFGGGGKGRVEGGTIVTLKTKTTPTEDPSRKVWTLTHISRRGEREKGWIGRKGTNNLKKGGKGGVDENKRRKLPSGGKKNGGEGGRGRNYQRS